MDATLTGLLFHCAESLDSTPHLILADWLDDHDQSERAELVRVQCQLADWVPDWQERHALIQRQDELIAAHQERWLGPLVRGCERVEFVRGLARVWVSGRTFATRTFGQAFTDQRSIALVEQVRLLGCQSFKRIAARPWLGHAPALSLASALNAEALEQLLASEHLSHLVDLDLSGTQIYDDGVEALLASSLFGRLARLDLRNNRLTGITVGALLDAASPRLHLDLAGNFVRLSQSPRLSERQPPGRLMNALGMEFVRVPAGSFLMGAADDEPGTMDDERPRHVVTLTRPFWLGRFAVTQMHYHDVMGYSPARFSGEFHPVEQVSWDEAMEFCRQLSQVSAERTAGRSYRLPTEAEWEHACRAGTFAAYHTGPTHSIHLMNCQQRFSINESERILVGHTTVVGSYPPNAFGLFDMHGNVWEWCADWYNVVEYLRGDVTNPPGPTHGVERVCRGGCWEAIGSYCRSAKRSSDEADTRDRYTGFRVVMQTNE